MREVMEWQTGRLRSVRDVTPDIRLFEIEPDGKFKTPTPGSHINVTVQIGGRPDVRSYSIVGPCHDGVYRIAVKLLPDSRGGSAYMFGLTPGAQLMISQPGNHFELGRGRPHYLLLRAASASRRSTPWPWHWRRQGPSSGCSMPAGAGRIWPSPTNWRSGSATVFRSTSTMKAAGSTLRRRSRPCRRMASFMSAGR